MKGILLAAHGSRAKTTEQTLEVLAEKVRDMTGVENMEIGFMEFSDRTIPSGLDRLRERGCTDVVVVPYFLFEGVHIREDIPELLRAYAMAHPDMRIRLGRTLGVDDRLAGIVSEQVQEVFAGKTGET